MKLLHVIPSVSERSGGPGQAIFPMCRALRKQGAEVLLASTNAGLEDSAELKLERSITYKGLPTILFPTQIGSSFKYSRPFAQWLDEHVSDYDLVHIHSVFNHASISAARSCRKRGVPYIVRPLGTLDPWSMKQKSLRKKAFWYGGIRKMLTEAAAIHYTSKAEQRAVEESLGLNHGAVIHLGVDCRPPHGTGDVNDLSEEFPSLRNYPYVLFMSRLHPKKALEILLEAFLSLAAQKEFSVWRLVVAGDGSPKYVRSLKQTVANRLTGDLVVFTGWLDGRKKEAALRNASILVLPSYQENFGLCVMEALAHGVPVLVSPHVNLAPEIEAAEAGWISALDSTALEAALADALSSREERESRGEAGRVLARKFAWPIIAGQLSDLYASVRAGHSVPRE